MRRPLSSFKPRSGAAPFLLYHALWGVIFGCFMACLNNYLVEIHGFDARDRGVLEFFRELPGLCLVFILALLHRVSDWKIMRLGAIIAAIGISALALPMHFIFVGFFVTLWAFGEHIVMPVRSAVAMQIAAPGKGGRALGILSSIGSAGMIAGNLMVAAVFFVGVYFVASESRVVLYNIVWIVAGLLAVLAVFCTLSKQVVDIPSARPRLLFRKKFTIFYALELLYGARKQIFLTFGPLVLIKIYGADTTQIALLLAVSAFANIFLSPVIGRLIDRFGYRTIMIVDTLILFWVCLLYGFAHRLFPLDIAIWVVSVNFLFDNVISTASMATSLYVKDISESQDELTSTLSTGISANHLVAVIAAPLGGQVWVTYGVGTLFVFAAVMALVNSAVAWCIKRTKGT